MQFDLHTPYKLHSPRDGPQGAETPGDGRWRVVAAGSPQRRRFAAVSCPQSCLSDCQEQRGLIPPVAAPLRMRTARVTRATEPQQRLQETNC